MLHKCLIFLLLCFLPGYIYALQPISDLVKRILPGYEDKFSFELLNSEVNRNIFEISSKNGKVLIKGDSPVSVACGLNWYLKYYCQVSVSFCEDQLNLPKELPLPVQIERHETKLTQNFYMNYCTFSYTTAFWDWKRWEREIDLMALNGITLPMAMVGTEVVWKNTLIHFGYSNEEIKDFLCGPAYFGWLLMGNMEKLGGPLPDEWFERQELLQKKIVSRMREYGMKPVFQGFFGMVPNSLSSKYPSAKIISQGEWNKLQRPPVLLPDDSLFVQMAKVWYTEYEKLYGKADFFGGDLFHEGGSTKDINVTEVARQVQSSMLAYNPNATWILQAWGGNPKKELLAGLDRQHTLIVDLCAEYWTTWKDRKGFDGFPWIWSHITNYGGNIGLHGRLDAIAQGPIAGLCDPDASISMRGIGSTPEGIEVNPVTFDLANEMRWRISSPSMEEWIRKYANRRYGVDSDYLHQAWHIFYHTAYGTYEGHRRPSESVFCALPSLKGNKITASSWSQCRIFYDPQKFAEGVALFLKEAKHLKNVSSYCYDVVDFIRQYIADLGRESYYKFVEAYQSKDKEKFNYWSSRFLELLKDQDRLLSAHPSFNVGRWLNQARAAGKSLSSKDLYEYNARMLIGTWSEERTPVRDYAHKEWGGMLRDYYYPRWEKYVSYLKKNLNGEISKQPDTYEDERMWVQSHKEYPIEVNNNICLIASEIFRKYYRYNCDGY